MAKYEVPFEDTQKSFQTAVSNAELDRYISVKILADQKLKKVVDVKKASELTKYESGVDVYIFVNEDIFDQLEETQQLIAIDEAITKIYYNTEKDKLEIKKEDVTAFSGVIRKHTYEVYERYEESVRTLFQVAKEKN